jgi:hypothetical protein
MGGALYTHSDGSACRGYQHRTMPRGDGGTAACEYSEVLSTALLQNTLRRSEHDPENDDAREVDQW